MTPFCSFNTWSSSTVCRLGYVVRVSEAVLGEREVDSSCSSCVVINVRLLLDASNCGLLTSVVAHFCSRKRWHKLPLRSSRRLPNPKGLILTVATPLLRAIFDIAHPSGSSSCRVSCCSLTSQSHAWSELFWCGMHTHAHRRLVSLERMLRCVFDAEARSVRK